MKPANKYLFVRPISEEKKGNVFIPLSNSINYKKGVVTHVSDQITQVKVGEEISYLKRIVAEVEENDVTLDVIHEETLMMIN